MFRYLWVLFLLLLCSSAANAQLSSSCTLSLSGTVVDQKARPLVGVAIRSTASNTVTYTDRQGTFKLLRQCPGEQIITFSFLGYDTVKRTITFPASEALFIEMKVGTVHVQDVQVTGIQSEHITSSRHHVSEDSKQELRAKPLAEMLSQIAGVSQLNTGASIAKPVINGLHSNRVLILNHGVRQEGQQWGAEHAPEIDPFTADRLEVIKGAEGVRYGADALGGVVISTANPIDPSKVSGRVDLLGQSNGRGGVGNIRLEGGIPSIPNLGWRIQASGKKIGNLRTADYFLGNTGVEELNLSGLLQYNKGRHDLEFYYSHFGTNLGIFYGAHVSTLEDILVNIERGRPSSTYNFTYDIASPRQRVDHDLSKIKWVYAFTGQTRLETQFAFQRNRRKEYDLRRVLSDDTPMADMNLTTQTLDIALKSGHHRIGIDGMLQVNNNVPGTGTTPIIPNFDNHNLGIYAITQHHWGKFHGELGARYDYRYFDVAGFRYDYSSIDENGIVRQYLLTDQRHFHNWSGSAGLAYHASSAWTWKTNLGLAWRAPSANELYSDGLHHGSGTYEVGDPNLASERGYKWVNSLLFQSENIAITTDLYAQYIKDYIYATPNPDSVRQTIRGTFPVFNYRQHDAFFYGVDVQLDWQINSTWSYALKGALVRARDLDNHTYFPFIPADRINQSVKWQYGEDSENYIRLAHVFVDRQHNFDPATDYTNPPPSYHLFNAYASARLPIYNRSVQCNLGIENLFNVLYKDYMDRMRYFSHQMGRNITLGFTFQF
ncbi:TonB-dependent receptor [Sphingobacterium sp. lm-10]|uniref:TonB-dependent receptor n=1 Tax=Sphingobacterium sp. lm-10 TaxID=2944904 RepID=UPI0020204738|nr:TonB-dependent receptor [Sphingobacterium sp. lm-10]MCL7986548.1 TonB-dependent receptor [Sphingobacterium sp. lm-10]